MKVFERVLEARLRKIVSVSLNQCGFVKDCSTIDAIHAVRILLEKHREKNRSVHLTFLDLEKAFDRVPHELLWMSMRSHRVPEEYVRGEEQDSAPAYTVLSVQQWWQNNLHEALMKIWDEMDDNYLLCTADAFSCIFR
ncbi:hypothetical protein RB195_018801 [Necator americanus]|uniref:Reverse transcriptase domain-containing protein n=1 Tax=Necator americanus TaxID=51031 RepID=A0ABR1CE85_NECAM